MLFGTWLADTLALQRDTYGQDPGALEGEGLAYFLMWNTLASIVESAEFIQETPWKPWSGKLKDRTSIDRDAAVEELVDVLHFVANKLLALRVTDEELNDKYLLKMQENRRRQASGTY